MRTRTTFRIPAMAAAVSAAFAAASMLVAASTPKFFSDDPIRVERDTQDASGIGATELNLFVEIARNIIGGAPVVRRVRAGNLNTVDEVPDSSWFTNRVGTLPLTPEDVATGPDATDGPAPGVWTVTSSKSDGVTPGFTVTDERGERWFLKFDPPGYRAMATGTEVAVTKLMWALGYHVPENHIAYLTLDQLVVGEGATFKAPGSRTSRPMRPSDIAELLARANREPDGSYRVVASRRLPGKPIGRIRFEGTRPDDPNDLVPHEHRRELRAYGVFAAWLNHVDAKAINTLDTLVEEEGRAYVRHHLIDFGSTLGSAGIGPADYWGGAEYLIEPGQIGRRMISFGLSQPAWLKAAFYESPAIGRFPADNASFDPERWKPRVPNAAFLHARADDKFWAASRLAAMTTDLIEAAVGAAQFGDPDAEAFLVRALADRRDAILRAYLPAVNPIVDPTLSPDGTLTFRNAAVEADVARAPQGYTAVWASFDNWTGAIVPLGESSGRSTTLDAPVSVLAAQPPFVRIDLRARGAETPAWEAPVVIYFRLRGGAWELVGLERLP